MFCEFLSHPGGSGMFLRCSHPVLPELPPCCISFTPPRGQQATLVFSFGYLKIVLLQVFPLYHGSDMHKFRLIPRSDLEEDPLFQTQFWLVVPDQLEGFFVSCWVCSLWFFSIPVGFIKFQRAGYEVWVLHAAVCAVRGTWGVSALSSGGAAGIPSGLEELILLRFRVSEQRNVSSQWTKLSTGLVLLVKTGNLKCDGCSGAAGEFIGNQGEKFL